MLYRDSKSLRGRERETEEESLEREKDGERGGGGGERGRRGVSRGQRYDRTEGCGGYASRNITLFCCLISFKKMGAPAGEYLRS